MYVPNLGDIDLFLSTLPVRGATPDARLIERQGTISIHAPREGSDFAKCDTIPKTWGISIHAPREGSDSSNLRIA